MRVGSASVRTTPTCSIACNVAVNPLNPPLTELLGVPLIGKGLVRVEIDDCRPEAGAAAEIDAQLLDDLAVHFRDRHFQHDLVAAEDDD